MSKQVNEIDLERVNRLGLHKHHLTADSRTDDIVQIAADISGLHATGAKEPYLALFARTGHFAREQLDDGLYVKRSLAKVRCMRGTLYILTREMVPVAFAVRVRGDFKAGPAIAGQQRDDCC